MPHSRPATAPDFLLSRASGSLRSQGSQRTFVDTWDAITALERREVEYVVGALPFDRDAPAALTVPTNVLHEAGTLEPHPYYRMGPGSVLHAEIIGMDPSPHEHLRRVEAAVATINESLLDKVVLARAVDIAFSPPVDPRLVAARLIDLSYTRDGFIADLSPAGRIGAMLVGSSPEQLIRKQGRAISSYPLAGSAPRIFDDAEADQAAGEALAESAKDLEEHAYVVDHIRAVLTPLCVELNVPDSPVLTHTNEMWHLATPITGVLKDDSPNALDLAARLYPTPAVCGSPQHAAEALITTAESDRSFYAGAVGWCNADGDGEYMVAIRCAEVSGDGTTARAWAGGGLVASSSPESELAETTAKLRTILRALGLEA
ncbi:isochorismate synthase [Corynebacterium aquatimens]|uniref:isochorismate synthase n=1 Tax=Corynebacterium aquatimens TaxID=1190508 RepID=A0A931E2S0_9CORY|nr:isochorismate synthase [Corynebacterium aquatimens]MBG6121443.1 isochorismate synthase [Corynebacterium aquatimens]WJY66013.1 Isochorismate synthase DhbC [Corynebacterium aquatimens]